MNILHFQSDLFPIEPQEDEETNPFRYGKSLAGWIHKQFEQLGYPPPEIIPEDWGWCVMLQRKPFMLWIGCCNEGGAMPESLTPSERTGYVPIPHKVQWRCMVQAESPFWTGFYWLEKLNLESTASAVTKVERELLALLQKEPRVFNLGIESNTVQRR